MVLQKCFCNCKGNCYFHYTKNLIDSSLRGWTPKALLHFFEGDTLFPRFRNYGIVVIKQKIEKEQKIMSKTEINTYRVETDGFFRRNVPPGGGQIS